MTAQRDNLLKRCDCDPARWPKCPHGWHVVGRDNAGDRYSVSLDKYAKRRALARPTTRGEAETLAERVDKEKQTGTYQDRPAASQTHDAPERDPHNASKAEPAAGLTFDQAWPKFVTIHYAGNASQKSEKSWCRRLANAEIEAGRFGGLPLVDITEADIMECFVEATCEEAAESSKKKLRKNLKNSFKWFEKRGYLTRSPITEDTKLPVGKNARRNRRLEPGEEDNLLQAARETRSDAARRLEALIVAALDICLRLGELLALQWRDVLWGERRIKVRAVEVGAQKTREERTVPMTPRLFLLLQVLATLNPTGKDWPGTAYVFGDDIGGRVKSIRKAWVTCVLRAHNVLPEWTGTALAGTVAAAFKDLNLHFHDLRHEGAQRWLKKGYQLGTIQRLLGHTDVATTCIYLGVEGQEALREAETITAAEWVAAGVVPAAKGPRGSKTAANATTASVLGFRSKGGTRRQMAG